MSFPIYLSALLLICHLPTAQAGGDTFRSSAQAGPTQVTADNATGWARATWYPECREACICGPTDYPTQYATQVECEVAQCTGLPLCWQIGNCTPPAYPAAAPALNASVCEAANMTLLAFGADSGACVPATCDVDTCPPAFGHCEATVCVPHGAYKGMLTNPHAMSTIYCNVNAGGCQGGACEFTTTDALQRYQVTGIAAVNPALFGLNQNRVPAGDTAWGQGCTNRSGICYYVRGPGGAATVAVTDRCAGYCRYTPSHECSASGSVKDDCGACIAGDHADQLTPGCPCAGAAPPLHDDCCGVRCPAALDPRCDWCASNTHPHFDLDDCTFNHVCGPMVGTGNCVLSQVVPYLCSEPPPRSVPAAPEYDARPAPGLSP